MIILGLRGGAGLRAGAGGSPLRGGAGMGDEAAMPERPDGVEPGAWVLPGGSVDPTDKSIAAAALRDTAAAAGSDAREMAMIAFAGGVGPLYNLLKDGSVEAQEYALRSLLSISDTAAKEAIECARRAELKAEELRARLRDKRGRG